MKITGRFFRVSAAGVILFVEWLHLCVSDFTYHVKRVWKLWREECRTIWKGDEPLSLFEKLTMCCGSIVHSWSIAHNGVAGIDARIKRRNTLMNTRIEKRTLPVNFSWLYLTSWAKIQWEVGFYTAEWS